MVIGFARVDFFGDKTRSQTNIFYIYFNWLSLKILYMNKHYELHSCNVNGYKTADGKDIWLLIFVTDYIVIQNNK